jgi:hypothetical protein
MELALILLHFLSIIDALLLMLYILLFNCIAGGHKEMSVIWLTKSALVNEPKWGVGCGALANEYSCAQCT